MNIRLSLISSAAVTSLLFLFPPWLQTFDARGEHLRHAAGAHFIFSAPAAQYPDNDNYSVTIDVTRLVLEWAACVAICLLVSLCQPMIQARIANMRLRRKILQERAALEQTAASAPVAPGPGTRWGDLRVPAGIILVILAVAGGALLKNRPEGAVTALIVLPFAIVILATLTLTRARRPPSHHK